MARKSSSRIHAESVPALTPVAMATSRCDIVPLARRAAARLRSSRLTVSSTFRFRGLLDHIADSFPRRATEGPPNSTGANHVYCVAAITLHVNVYMAELMATHLFKCLSLKCLLDCLNDRFLLPGH